MSSTVNTALYIGGKERQTAEKMAIADPAGFALSVSGTVSVDRLCGGTTDTVSLQLMGDVAVAAQ